MASDRRSDLEDLWRSRLTSARRRYETAREACKEALAAEGDNQSPDGSFAYRQALRAENAPNAEYNRVLTIFCDLRLSGIMPPAE